MTEDYFIGDLELPPAHHHHHPHHRYWADHHAGLLRRRISCPGLNNNRSLQTNNNNLNNIVNNNSRVPLMTDLEPTTTSNAAAPPPRPANPRRHLRRYLTADSAVLQQLHQLTDNKRQLAQKMSAEDPSSSRQQAAQPMNLWTSGLMAEFNHVIDGEIERLSSRREEPEGAEAEVQDGRIQLRKPTRRLSPWARMQMALIDPPLSPSSLDSQQQQQQQQASRASIEQLSADIDSVQRQILHDLDDLTATLERREKMASKPSAEEPCEPPAGPSLVSFFFPFPF